VKTAKYSRTVSNYKKGDAKGRGPEGGYLVSNGRGLGITFALHHAQPSCVELSMLDPSGQVRLYRSIPSHFSLLFPRVRIFFGLLMIYYASYLHFSWFS